MNITSNYNKREFLSSYEVPEEILKEEFDWCDSDYGFFKYKGTWYHISQFMRLPSCPGWNGVLGDSYFSGVVLFVPDGGEFYKVGYYTT